MAVAPYSPTAHGFFDGKNQNPRNQGRRARATELAQKKGATPNQINLAWLVNHPFAVFPILGTKNLGHLEEALAADDLRLSTEELAWLCQD